MSSKSIFPLPHFNLISLTKKISKEGRIFGLTKKFFSILLTMILIICIYKVYKWDEELKNQTTIIIITPTHKRVARLADMTRLSQTLMHIPDVHWIVIEDGTAISEPVRRLLKRSRIPYTYFFTTTLPGFPKRGWTHRNMGLEYVRKHYINYNRNAVVYFADDDNSYDLRLFDYIRQVKTIGIWAVGLAGGAIVEAPKVVNGTITGWNVVFAPGRTFGTDMAGATFSLECAKESPEPCFLNQFYIPKEKAQPFGYDNDPKEVLVWHTKTVKSSVTGGSYGYVAEY